MHGAEGNARRGSGCGASKAVATGVKEARLEIKKIYSGNTTTRNFLRAANFGFRRRASRMPWPK